LFGGPGGEAPAYADYFLFGTLQFPRLGSPRELLAADDPVHRWREQVSGLFRNLGDRFPRHPRA